MRKVAVQEHIVEARDFIHELIIINQTAFRSKAVVLLLLIRCLM